MRIHLDLIGGMAGDMFIAALLDALPDRRSAVLAAIGQAFSTQTVRCDIEKFNDTILTGSRFHVEQTDVATGRQTSQVQGHHTHSHDHEAFHGDHMHGHGHEAFYGDHTHWRDIRTHLSERLTGNVLRHATGIFQLLAEAEGRVHGVPADAVQFHEVGAWDSIADIVGAACLIDSLDARWTVSAVPLGGGRVATAHGTMPVPAPATAHLLEGFVMLDDGIPGERVTPTGAAILRYLCAATDQHAVPTRSTLLASGIGFGTRKLPGISNCVRALVMDDAVSQSAAGSHRQLAVIEFEVDDQTAEDLAMGLTHLRAHPAIYDVVQTPVFGKKGRMATSVRLLASPARIDEALEACFMETSTIGLRYHVVNGAALPRQMKDVMVDGERIRVKCVQRPGGSTAKAESDDVMTRQNHARRMQIRAQAALGAASEEEPE
jgi:uncharacterized protein (TIGR00299 family) protein